MIHRAIRLMREFHGLSVRELESEIKISSDIIKKIEAGIKPISKDILDKYSKRFDVPLSSLVFISELPKSPKESESFIKSVKFHITSKALRIMEWTIEREKKESIKA